MQLSAIIPDTIVVVSTNNIPLIGEQTRISTQDILLIIWAIGAVAFLFWHLSTHIIFCRGVRRFGKQADSETQKIFNSIKSELKIKKDIKLILYKEVSSPIMLGFFSSCVLLPNTDFEKADLEAIFTHELIHCRHHDLWYKLMILLARSVQWFNPLVHMMAYAANRDIEISCDEEVIKNTDTAFRRQYAESVLSVIRKNLQPKTTLSTNFYGGKVRKTWPESDVEMMELTIPTYINKERFHTYYMSVSGHMSYTFSGNFQAEKHKSEVQNLDLPDECKAYLACNIVFDRAMKYLLQKLDEAGKLDNTVIVISADHYPYGLSKKGIDALAGHTVEENFELYKSSLIIWKKGLPTKIIDQPASSLDIIPTISNLFNLEYDSRLLMGRDILSDSDPLVIFSNRSWITDKALYNSKTGEVKDLTSKAVTDEYVRGIKKLVSDKFEYSAKILDNDYYGKILK